MKNGIKLAVLTLSLASANAHAFPTGEQLAKIDPALRDVFTGIYAMYGLGNDNNGISSEIMTEKALLKRFKGRKITKFHHSEAGATEAIDDCVFLEEGAYGEHISKALADRMTVSVMDDLRDLSVDVYRIEGEGVLEDYIISAPCAAGLVDYDGTVILLQAHSHD